MRNAIAHGSAQVMLIRDKPYVRWIPPAHDTIRVGRKIANRQIPGLQPGDIEASRRPFVVLLLVLESMNLFVRESHEGGFTLREEFRRLETQLRAFRSLYPGAEKKAGQKTSP